MESRIEITERLRAEGLWEEACKFRESKRNELRDGGVSRREAMEMAWQAMVEQFPPPEAPAVGEPGNSAFDDSTDSNDWVRDVFYVYNNMGKSTPSPSPSTGAACLLNWAQKNQARFFENLLPKAITVAEKRGEERKQFEDDGRKIFQRLEQYELSLANQHDAAIERLGMRVLDCFDRAHEVSENSIDKVRKDFEEKFAALGKEFRVSELQVDG